MRQIAFTVLRGFLMGSADIVPGVSGGTVALVLGIYRRLIASIRSGSSAIGMLLRGDVRRARGYLGEVEWVFLISLLSGVLLAIVTLAHLVETLLADYPVPMAGLLFGLVLGSVVVAWQLLERRDATRIMLLVLAAGATFVLLGLRESTSTDDVGGGGGGQPLVVFFLSGAIAICAMILPGISGSFLLVMLGMYASVLAAVTDRDLLTLAVFALGCAVGLGLFSQVLHWALGHHYDTVMAILVGLMVGSVRVLWPWPNGVDSTALGAPTGPVAVPILLAVLALVVVVAFDHIARRLEHRSSADEVADLQAS
ncbi:MAG: DUF368 domain-containing protein [Ilumatobacteraceae bacterium]